MSEVKIEVASTVNSFAVLKNPSKYIDRNAKNVSYCNNMNLNA